MWSLLCESHVHSLTLKDFVSKAFLSAYKDRPLFLPGSAEDTADAERQVTARLMRLSEGFLNDDASLVLSPAPPNSKERRASALESSESLVSSNRGLSIAASTNECAECPITLMAGTLGPAFAS